MCSLFGWSIEQVLSLTWPQFEYISLQIYRLHYSIAKNEIFFGVSAAFGGEKCRKNLFESAGTFVCKTQPDLSYTQKELDIAMKIANDLIKKGNNNA